MKGVVGEVEWRRREKTVVKKKEENSGLEMESAMLMVWVQRYVTLNCPIPNLVAQHESPLASASLVSHNVRLRTNVTNTQNVAQFHKQMKRQVILDC